jgi:multidrug transporter EmrE-like cation transporter
MTIVNVLMMTLAELFGNTHLKWFSDSRGRGSPALGHLAIGVAAYLTVIFFLTRAFASQSMMWTCIMWEAMIVIGGALTAYLVFGETFDHWIQWLGILLALGAALCVNYRCST